MNLDSFFEKELTASRIPIEHVLQQLHHLNVGVYDNTGHGGQRYWSTPLSAAKSSFPNATHAFQLFRFIKLAENLTSLQISSNDILNLDDLDFSSLDHLHILYLSDTAISSENFLSLIERCSETMSRIEFLRVELNSGTWQDILVQISQLRSLRYFHIDSSGYSQTGQSSHLAPGLLPPLDDPQDIETHNFLDYNALGNVQRKVNANRSAVQLPQMTSFDYRRTQREPLEDVLRRIIT
jgi:hypothetical protein